MKRNSSIFGILAYAGMLIAMLTSYIGLNAGGLFWPVVSAVAMTVAVMCIPFGILTHPDYT